jgi:hypothetical protein
MEKTAIFAQKRVGREWRSSITIYIDCYRTLFILNPRGAKVFLDLLRLFQQPGLLHKLAGPGVRLPGYRIPGLFQLSGLVC